ncbi:MAG: hypothetical protein JWQ89_3336 [Devosia sp.]|uniref:hypothetical protein n=1 Tax=Devosia sp. TaxID=1871048 RepID=UPI00262E933B|nr:hypothetical protein [Devosia sp.]MDB5541609.1 hypothetical protein [Devosia sp.]
MSDRATLDQIAVIRQLTDQLAEMDERVKRYIDSHPDAINIVITMQLGVWRCQGLVQQLRLPAIPPARDAVDEASAEVGETWD